MAAPAAKLTEQQRRHLRGLAHALHPVARLGSAGITAAFLTELEAQLAHHELVKIRVAGGDREARRLAIAGIVDRTGATLIARIGNVAVLYRVSPEEPRLALPAGQTATGR